MMLWTFVSVALAKYCVSISWGRKFYSKSFSKKTMANLKDSSFFSSMTRKYKAKSPHLSSIIYSFAVAMKQSF